MPADGSHAPESILVLAARRWREAQVLGEPAQPHLARTLAVRDGAMLAPALDSLCRSFEAVLGRPIVVGEADGGRSEDESALVALVDGGPRQDCPGPSAGALDCALCSARIMLGLANSG